MLCYYCGKLLIRVGEVWICANCGANFYPEGDGDNA